MMDNYLEPEFAEPYRAWKAGPSPATSRALLGALGPTIEQHVRRNVGETNPIFLGRARRIALDSLAGYDPSRARLSTYLGNQLLGMRRVARQPILKVPERVVLDRYNLETAAKDLAGELGREPSDQELADRTGFSLKRISHVRRYRSGASEGMFEAMEGFQPGVAAAPEAHQAWVELVYQDLAPIDQKILEWSIGLHGRKPLSNQEIARKLGRSPGAISQRKKQIQALLDQEQGLSPF